MRAKLVRAQMTERLVWPGYDQDRWVAVQKHKERPWTELVRLWEQLNRHIAHVMANVPAGRLGTKCVIEDHDPVTLEWLMSDYVRHLRHHLHRFIELIWQNVAKPTNSACDGDDCAKHTHGFARN